MIRNLTSTRSGKAVANQFEIHTKKGDFFQSYQTLIAHVDNNGQVWLSNAWDYSNTTRKYLYQFLRDYGWNNLSASEIRKLIKDGTFKYKATLTM